MANPRKFKVTFLDDTPEKVVHVGHGTIVAIERRWPEGAPLNEALAFGAFVAGGYGSPKDEDAFEDFLIRLDEVVAEDAVAVDPSPEAATDA